MAIKSTMDAQHFR